jgi:hypothetical protein
VRDSIRLRQNIKNVLIDGNSFLNIGVKSSESSDAIDSYWSGEEMIITNNYFSGIASHGLDIKGVSPDAKSKTSKVIISNNIFDSIQFSGILVSSGAIVKGKSNMVSNFNIISNQFFSTNLNNKNVNDAAIFLRHGVQDSIISNNIIDAEKSHGIVIASFDEKADQTSNIIISSNLVKSIFSPVYLVAVKRVMISGNNFYKKKVKSLKTFRKLKESDIVISNNL